MGMDVKYVAFAVHPDGRRETLVKLTTLPAAKAAVTHHRKQTIYWKRPACRYVIEAVQLVVTATWEVDAEGGLVPVGTKEGGE